MDRHRSRCFTALSTNPEEKGGFLKVVKYLVNLRYLGNRNKGNRLLTVSYRLLTPAVCDYNRRSFLSTNPDT